jgi:hypothetical protein
MDEPRKPGHWELDSVQVTPPFVMSATCKALLSTGWEPFAVEAGRVWFRRWHPYDRSGL